MSKTPRTLEMISLAFGEDGKGDDYAAYARAMTLCKQLETELADMRESEERFSKCFERIARAVGITSPLVLLAMAESDEENYAEILARHIENREKAKEVLGL
jgi:hypothetical protein